VIYCGLLVEWLYRRHTKRIVQKQYKPLVRDQKTVIPMPILGRDMSSSSPASSRQAENGDTEAPGSDRWIDTMVFLIIFSTLLIVIR
jgi:hypothetical protein